ncbi:hypothetical protein DPEC_G00031250 [Dallia pectoralis]|uniref:Uncharacterized protein n=1 Tax=Dallia pectoralis TaxID=75939 RepID=A0ACC2HCY9_DALPE|nr:hypothetical protein DPEC_G00031250 [Dallia pectoralis]
MSEEKQRVTEENLQGSWVELHFNHGDRHGSPMHVDVGVDEEGVPGSAATASIYSENLAPGSTTAPVHGEYLAPGSTTASVHGEYLAPGSTTASVQGEYLAPGSTTVSFNSGLLTSGSTTASLLPGDLATGSSSVLAQGSELIPGSGSVQGVVDLERMLLDAQRESGRSSSRGSLPCDSPPRPQTPLHRWGSEVHSSGEKNSSQSEEDYLERRHEVENLMKKNADWIWDWSSRPENVPRKEFVLRHPKRTNPLSIRNTSAMKKGGIFSAEFLKVFLPSLFISHILAIGLGVYIGRRLTTSVTSTI